jgi:hypothetical protein
MPTKQQTPTVRIGLNEAEYRALKSWCAMEGMSVQTLFTRYARTCLARRAKNKALISVDETDSRDD